ncbi:MAG: hypothetical protein GX221_09315 [Candidatus Riflebacteria bacterium]|nr:hypothetical protein [Candidatus Riflebacteria bacterium]
MTDRNDNSEIIAYLEYSNFYASLEIAFSDGGTGPPKPRFPAGHSYRVNLSLKEEVLVCCSVPLPMLASY